MEFFNEPAVSDPPHRVTRDWFLVAAVLFAAVMEWIFNDELIWRTWHMGLVVAMIPTLLWRRTQPLLMLAIVFVLTNLSLLAAAIFAEVPDGPYTAIFVVFNLYALFRWGSGRHCLMAVGLILAATLLNMVIDYQGIGEVIGGIIFVLIPAEAGAVVRFQQQSAERAEAEIRSTEREQIARELHDSVAHHVSAIAIQAQAGRRVAATNPEAVIGTLEAIEEAAARTLSDMRSMVGSLRDGGDAELVPQQGLREIATLAGEKGGITVVVRDLPERTPSTAVGAALFRIAQESVTNAVRHAAGASTVDVEVSDRGDSYRLTVRDNGRRVTESNTAGYGLIGMAERARLLGGSIDAGPASGGGWLVTADLPMQGVRA